MSRLIRFTPHAQLDLTGFAAARWEETVGERGRSIKRGKWGGGKCWRKSHQCEAGAVEPCEGWKEMAASTTFAEASTRYWHAKGCRSNAQMWAIGSDGPCDVTARSIAVFLRQIPTFRLEVVAELSTEIRCAKCQCLRTRRRIRCMPLPLRQPIETELVVL